MLFDILITIPSLVMAEIAGCVRLMLIAACFAGVFVVTIGILGLWRSLAVRRHSARLARGANPLAEA